MLRQKRSYRFGLFAVFILSTASFAFFTLIMCTNNTVVGQGSSRFGEQRILVIAVYFPDLYPSTTLNEVEALLEEADLYIREVSYGKTWITWTIHGWLLVSQPSDHYGLPAIGATEGDSYRLCQLLREVLGKMDSRIDFRQFNRIILYHAGPSMQCDEAGGDAAREKWIDTSNFGVSFVSDELAIVESVSIVSEMDGRNPSVGSFVHELGHDFGAHDLYDPEHGVATDIGNWDLMSDGDHNNHSQTPCHMSIYTKLDLGFLAPNQIVPITNGTYRFELTAISVNASGFYGARFGINASAYYLIEARKQVGFDASLDDEGVVVYVVNVTRSTQEGRVLFAPDPRYEQYDLAYHPGDFFIDPVCRFGVAVIRETETGYMIEATTDASCEWMPAESLSGVVANSHLSSTTLLNGTVLLAIDTLNWQGTSIIEVYRSLPEDGDWKLLWSTPENMNRTNPWLVQQIDYYWESSSSTPFLVCESYGPGNHFIESWNLNTFVATNLTLPTTDSRNPCVSYRPAGFYLGYEMWENDTRMGVALVVQPSPIYTGPPFRFIDNASEPRFTEMSLNRTSSPYVSFLKSTSSGIHELWLETLDGFTQLCVANSSLPITEHDIASNMNGGISVVVYAYANGSRTDCAVSVVLHIDDEFSICTAMPLEVVDGLKTAPISASIIDENGTESFAVAYNIGDTFLLVFKGTDIQSGHIQMLQGLPNTQPVVNTHRHTNRWKSPLLFLHSDNTMVRSYRYGLLERSHYDYYPVFFTQTEYGVSLPLVHISVLGLVCTSVSLISLGLYARKRGYIGFSHCTFVFAVVRLVSLALVLTMTVAFWYALGYLLDIFSTRVILFAAGLVMTVVFARTSYGIVMRMRPDDTAETYEEVE